MAFMATKSLGATQPRSHTPSVLPALLALLALHLLSPATPAHALRSRASDGVREAALALYVHGMTASIADQHFGASSEPELLALLADPSFPRRDNVVAVLGFIGSTEATRALAAFLARPPALITDPEEDRALLLAPQSLGQIAARGDAEALDLLLAMTAAGSNGGLLASTAARSRVPSALRDDLLQMALSGLARAGQPIARERLEAIASGLVRPAEGGRDLRGAARSALARFDGRDTDHAYGSHAADGADLQDAADASDREDGAPAATGEQGSIVAPQPGEQKIFDASHSTAQESALSFANHVNVTSPMTESRLDANLKAVSLHLGRADFSNDVACCTSVVRTGPALAFGQPTDGLDIIDSVEELSAVLNDSVARFKVVRGINWCGGPATNVIGCAWVGGAGAAVVRYGDESKEGILWIHEYGHNTGLQHNTTSSNYIMYYALYPTTFGLTQSECNAFHTPGDGTRAIRTERGACSDGDLDEVQDAIDNCPTVANNDQADADLDGVGDACESLSLCGNGRIDPGEECDGNDIGQASCASQGCAAGTPACSVDCHLDYASCTDCGACDRDGLCEAGENCSNCASDCASVAGARCGNGTCEASDGEDCLSCPSDCRGVQDGRPSGRYCCGSGGQKPVGCADARCSEGAWECTTVPATPSCCGDQVCEGSEDGNSCELDCGAPPRCGDSQCTDGESPCSCPQDCGLPPTVERSCSDGHDEDCDGFADCKDSDCSGDSACVKTCRGRDVACSTNADCCSNKCRTVGTARVCR